jgi:restriction system protein
MIPDYQTLILPILRLAGTGSFRTVEAVDQVANEFHLTSEERAELLPAGRQTILANRVHWALAQLSKAKLLNRLRQGMYEITDLGSKVLLNPPPRIDIVFLSQFDHLDQGGADALQSVQRLVQPERKPNSASDTPDERIEAALTDLNTALRADLLERVQAMTPNRFEKLVVDLMLGMRYGAAGSGKHLGRTSDGGVDGIINEDVLGLDVIYLSSQALCFGQRNWCRKDSGVRRRPRRARCHKRRFRHDKSLCGSGPRPARARPRPGTRYTPTCCAA